MRHLRGRHLFEVALLPDRPAPATTCTDVELVDTTRCPTCGAPVREHGWAQPALFWFGGYGATVLRTSRRCSGCGWQLPYDEQSLNPRNAQRAPIAAADSGTILAIDDPGTASTVRGPARPTKEVRHAG